MRRNIALFRTTCIAFVTCLVSACQNEPAPASNVKFSAPQRILQVRAVDQNQLRPAVRLSNGRVVPMQRTDDGSWSGTINVTPNSTYFVSVEWIETMPTGQLVLATWTENVAVDADGTQVNLTGADYDYSSDADGDNIDNLQERQNGTDPFVPNGVVDGENVNTDGDSDGDTNNNDSNNTAGQNNTDSTSGEDNDGSSGNNTNSNSNTGAATGNTDANGASDNDSENTTSADETDGGNNGSSTVAATVLIPRIQPSNAPDINGKGAKLDNQDNLEGEWAKAVQFDNAGERLWINSLMIDRGSDAEDGAMLRRWAAMHDGTNLYILVLADDVGQRQSDSDNIWQDDDLGLFIDGDNSKRIEWGDDDDFHYHIALQKQNSKAANNELNGRYTLGPGSSKRDLNIEFSTGPGEGPDGIRISKWEQDVYELSIPLTSAGIQVGRPFGLELQMDDDDDGNGRDSKWGWFHPSRINDIDTDETYLNPSIMGTVVLEQ